MEMSLLSFFPKRGMRSPRIQTMMSAMWDLTPLTMRSQSGPPALYLNGDNVYTNLYDIAQTTHTYKDKYMQVKLIKSKLTIHFTNVNS